LSPLITAAQEHGLDCGLLRGDEARTKYPEHVIRDTDVTIFVLRRSSRSISVSEGLLVLDASSAAPTLTISSPKTARIFANRTRLINLLCARTILFDLIFMELTSL